MEGKSFYPAMAGIGDPRSAPMRQYAIRWISKALRYRPRLTGDGEEMRKAMAIVPAALAALLVSWPAAAATVVFEWQGDGRSEAFTVPNKSVPWQAAWECGAGRSPKIAIISVASGAPVDSLGASYRGERLIAKGGRFQLDAQGEFCKVTVTTNE